MEGIEIEKSKAHIIIEYMPIRSAYAANFLTPTGRFKIIFTVIKSN